MVNLKLKLTLKNISKYNNLCVFTNPLFPLHIFSYLPFISSFWLTCPGSTLIVGHSQTWNKQVKEWNWKDEAFIKEGTSYAD